MTYHRDIPYRSNPVLDAVSGDLPRMRENFDEIASVISGVTRPAAGEPMSHLVVTSGSDTFGLGWSTVNGAIMFAGYTMFRFSSSSIVADRVLRGLVAPTYTEPTHFVRMAELYDPPGMVEALGGHVVTLSSGALFVLDERAMYDYDVMELHAQTASGAATITAKIGASAISGLDGITVSGSQTSHAASGAYSVTSGDRLTLTIDSMSGDPSDLSFTIKTVRSTS